MLSIIMIGFGVLSATLCYVFVPWNAFPSLVNPLNTRFGIFICGVLLLPLLKRVLAIATRRKEARFKNGSPSESLYGLDHGRLHLKIPPTMWMNMGYWQNENDEDPPPKLAQACRNLLCEVLRDAGFCKKRDSSKEFQGVRPTRALLDLGFGCGDQTVYLMSRSPVRETDRDWWDSQIMVPKFDLYTGITLDRRQYAYAQSRVHELNQEIRADPHRMGKERDAVLFCADASDPNAWNDELRTRIQKTMTAVDERWVLALDTAYHFAPSRWEVIIHACQTLNASFMGFDLCISDDISISQLFVLRVLTTLLGAPWTNFVTIKQYQQRLIEAGYTDVKMRDVSPKVFIPLSTYLAEQDQRLKTVGYGLGSFKAAMWMFSWWGRSGVVRGVIVVART